MTTTVDPGELGPDELGPVTVTFAPMPPPTTRSRQVIAALAVPGVDLIAARAVVEERYRRRRTATWVRVGATVGTALLCALVLVLIGRSDERVDTVAVEPDPTTTSMVSTTTSTAVPAVPAPAAPTPTAGAAGAVAPPLPPAPMVRQPLSATVSLTGPARVGTAVTLRVEWNDADHAVSGDPEVFVDWGDPVVAAPATSSETAGCATAGAPRAGTVERTFRYATAGPTTISVRLRSCDGTGPFGEDVTVTSSILVESATSPTVVASVGSGTPDPDLASAVRYPADGGAGGALPLRTPAVGSVLTMDPGRRATVLSSTAWTAGDVVILAWIDGSCRWGTVGADVGSAGLRLEESGCQAVLPVPSTTTVPSTSVPATSVPASPTPAPG